MSEFEYVMVLISLILGLGISQILVGIANLLKKSHKVKFYIPHLICIVVVFMIHIQEWWINYEYSRKIMEWRFSVFFFMVAYPILLYIMARLLFPLHLSAKSIDLREFYMVHYRKFFLFGFMMSLMAIPQNLFLLDVSLGDQLNQILITLVLLIPIIFKTRKDWVHYSLVTIMAGIGVFYIIIINPKL